MKPRHAAALVLVGWYLMVPATASKSGTAEAGPAPSIWGSYKTREACEQDRQSLVDDPVVGERMKAAKCLPSTSDNHQVKPQ
jgi:hypothetical protein